MSFDAFLKITDIAGESSDLAHREWIELLGFSWGVSQGAGAAGGFSGGSASRERADFQDFTVVKSLDAASAKLALACANGKHIREVELSVCRAAGDKQGYYEIKLSDVLIAKVTMDAEPQSRFTLPTETISFNFGKIEWVYRQTDPRTGKPTGTVHARWSIIENKGG